MRKRLKTWYAQTNNAKRRLNVHACFAGLLRWITTHWSQPTWLLAMDATTISNRWIILSVSVLYKQRAIPVAWQVLPWHKQKWNPLWEPLLRALALAFPTKVQGLALADRDLYSPEWFASYWTLVGEAERLERVWLALAVATLWVLWYGTDVEAARRVWGSLWVKKRRVVSVFRMGWLLLLLEALGCVEGLRSGWFADTFEPVEEDRGSWA
jgi:hypothetical protein